MDPSSRRGRRRASIIFGVGVGYNRRRTSRFSGVLRRDTFIIR